MPPAVSWLLSVIFVLCFSSALSLKCVQCNSTLDHNCQEKFEIDNPNNPIKSEPCTVWNARYCIKVTGLWGGIVGTHRFCTSRDLGDQCQDIFYPDHDRMYRACVYTCRGDDCNGAASNWSLQRLFTVFVVAVLAALTRWL